MRTAAAVVLGILVLWIALTHSSLTRSIVLPRVASALGVELDADRVVITIDGHVVMEGLEARVPEIDHAAATFARIDRVTASINWATLFTQGRPTVRQIALTNPAVRISQSIEDRTLNIAALKIVSSAGPLDLPTITTQNAIIEVGEHTSTKYTALRRLFVAGDLTPAPGPVRAFNVNLREAGESIAFPGSPTGLLVEGTIDDDGAAITLSGISLDGIDPSAVPSPIRSLYTALDLKGAVTEARFNYSSERGVVVTMSLEDVDITPPVPPEPGATRPMRMHGTSGNIQMSQNGLRAELSGTVEDLPYEVDLDYLGVTADAAFTATIHTSQFAWGENPDLLPHAPPIVRQRLANFSNPTAIVDASLTISRADPTESGPAPVQVDGRLEFVQGEAAFDKFPYPFENMTARVHFTDERIVVEEVTGVSPSGAPLVASALIEPLTPDAFVNVDIDVKDVPIDDLLLECLGAQRRELVDAILSRREYQRLLDAGVISTDGEGAPKFELGGVGDMKVNVQRERGNDDIWHVLVNVTFDEVGFLVDRFPYPIIGTDVSLRIEDNHVELVDGTFTGLEGGNATVVAEATFAKDVGGGTYVPTIHVEADNVPLGDLIASALPDDPLGEAAISPRHIVHALGMGGLARASIDVGIRENGALGYDATAEIRQATSAPSPLEGAEPMVARDIDASIISSETNLHITASAVIGDGAAVSMQVDSEIGLSTASRVTARSVDTTLPLECYVAIFSPDAAEELKDTRVLLRPQGLIDLDLRATSTADTPPTTTVEITVPDALALDLFDGHVEFNDFAGSAILEAGEDPRISFLDASARLFYDNAAAGTVTMSGRVPLAALAKRKAPDIVPEDLGALQVRADDALVESGLARWIIASYLPAGALGLYDEHQPRGLLDADVTLSTIVDEDGHYTWDPVGTLRPELLTIQRRDLDVPLRIAGSVEFAQRWGQINDVLVTAPTWTGAFAGGWQARAMGIDYEATIDLDAPQGLTPDLRAMLVAELIKVIDDVKLTIDGPMSIKGAQVRGLRTDDDVTSDIAFHGDIHFSDASLEPGVEVTECTGLVDVGFEYSPQRGPPAYEMAFRIDRLRAAKVRMTEARALVLSAERDKELLMPHFSARAHAGRISATAHLWPSRGTDLDYRTDVRISGVQFGPLLADLQEPADAPPGEQAADEVPEDPWLVKNDRSRGEIDAGISLGGIVGKTETRRGSGVIEILGGNVLRLPTLIVQLIELSNLQPPANEELDYARASFFIDGDFVGFEDLSVFSRTVAILGSGSMSWQTQELDLRFHTRAARRIPMLSQLIEGIRDELATAIVRGPVDDYEVRVEQFPGDSALIESLFNARRNRIPTGTRQPDAAPLEPTAGAGLSGSNE